MRPIPHVVDLLRPSSTPDPGLRETFQRIVSRRLRPATLGLALALAVLGVSDLVVPGDHPGSPAGLPECATAAVLFAVFLGLGRIRVPARWAEPFAAGLFLLSSVALLYHLAFGDPDDTTYLALLALGAGALLLSLRWLIVVLGGMGAGWIGISVAVGEPGWVRNGVALAIAIMLGLLTQRMRTEALVGAERERRRFSDLIEHAQDVVAVVGAAAEIRYVSPAVERILGRRPEELVDTSALELVHPDDVPAAGAIMGGDLLSGADLPAVTLRMRHRDGCYRYMECVVGGRLRDPSVAGVIVNARDVTERVGAEEARRETSARLEALVRAAPLAVLAMGLDGTVRSWNPAAERIFGWTEQEAVGSFLPFVPPEKVEEFRRLRDHLLHDGPLVEVELVRQRKDGEPVEVSLSAAPVRDTSGTIVDFMAILADIGERKAAERELARVTKQLQEAQSMAHIGSWEVDLATGVAKWSPEMRTLFGVEPGAPDPEFESVLGRVHPEDRELVADRAQDALEHGRTQRYEHRLLDPDGSVRWLLATIHMEPGEDGRPVRMVGAVQDVTERKLAEEALAESLRRFRALAARAPVGIFETDPDGACVYVNESLCEMQGVPAEQLIGQAWADTLFKDDVERVWLGWLGAVADGRDFRSEFRFRRRDGDVRWVVGTTTPLLDASGELTGYMGTVTDITDRRRAEDALRETETRLRTLVEQTPGIIYIDRADASMTTVYVSPRIEKVLGVSPEEYMGDPLCWERHIHEEDRDSAIAGAAQLIETDIDENFLEYRWVRPDGRAVWINDRGTKIRDAQGRPIAIQGVMLDVTERKRSEDALRETEARFRALVEHVPAVTYMELADRNGTIAYVSPQVESMLGYTQQEYADDPRLWARTMHPDDVARVEAHDVRTNQSGEPFAIEYRMRARDGRTVWVWDEAVLMRTTGGEPAYWLGFMFDITERKVAEDLLRESAAELEHSLEAIHAADAERRDLVSGLLESEDLERGRLAEGIEDGQIQHMAAVGIRLEALRRGLTDPAQLGAVDKLAETVQLAVGRLRSLLVQLRPRALEQDGLGPALEQYVRAVAPGAGPEVHVEDRMERQPALSARTTAYRIAQEAISNALRHAGASRIDVALGDLDDGVLVQVADDGSGFDWTGAPKAEQAGLASMWERAELAGGWLRIRTSAGTGTVVEWWLPGGPVEAEAAAP